MAHGHEVEVRCLQATAVRELDQRNTGALPTMSANNIHQLCETRCTSPTFVVKGSRATMAQR
jgi:hypothetical protein